MSRFSTEVKVGIFVLVAIIILVIMALRVGRYELGKEKDITVSALFNNASGLGAGVPVEIAGIEIGIVEGISLVEGRALVAMRIRSDLKLGVDSQAVIRTSGVLGDKFIEIIPGLTGAPELVDGGRIIQTQAPADLDQLLLRIGEIALDIRRVTQSLNNVLGGVEGTASLRNILINLQETTLSLSRIIADNNQNVNQIVSDLASFSKDIRAFTSDNKTELETLITDVYVTTNQLAQTLVSISGIADKINQGTGTLGDLINSDTVIKEINQTVASINGIVDKINRGQGILGGLITDSETSQNFDRSLVALRNMSEKIDKGEGTLGRLVHDEDTAERVDQALTGLNNLLSKTDALMFFVDYHTDYLFDSGQARTQLDLKIQPKQERYYLIGLVDDPQGTLSTRVVTTTDALGTSTTTYESIDPSGLKFNAQFARRYYDLVMRAGVFESKAGLGLDYHFLNDNLKFTLEAYNLINPGSNPHLKFMASLELWNMFYLDMGYDDFLNKATDSFFVGFGLRFSDEDLKYVLTSIPLP
jgi:phospholipid/cholesterol/gamma-HCH transport system substrate-binding protein